MAPPCSATWTRTLFPWYCQAAFATALPSYCELLILTLLNHFVVAFVAALRGYITLVITFRHLLTIWLASVHAHYGLRRQLQASTLQSLKCMKPWYLRFPISFLRLSLDKSLRGRIELFFVALPLLASADVCLLTQGVIQERRCCEGMQPRRLGCCRWRIWVQFCHRCKDDSEWKMVRGGRAEAPVPRSDVSFRLDQKTGNFKASIAPMQWSALTEEKLKNQLAQTEFRFIKKTI